MSKHVNVNPGQYKVAGREAPGKDVAADLLKQKFAAEKAREAKATAGTPPKPAKARKRLQTPGQR